MGTPAVPNCEEKDGDVCRQGYILGSMGRWRVNSVYLDFLFLWSSFGSDSSSLEMLHATWVHSQTFTYCRETAVDLARVCAMGSSHPTHSLS